MEPVTKASPPRSAKIHRGPGFRIRSDIARPGHNAAALFADMEVADISDHLNRLYALDERIKYLSGNGGKLIGPACTVRVYPGDNLMVHKSLDIAKPGDVVVIDAHGSRLNAVLGDMISTKAKHRGIAGFVVDGYVRDLDEVRAKGFPIFARGATPIGPLHRGPGEINFPICCGGVVVHPGDLVVADNSGIVIIPQGHIMQLHRSLAEYLESSADYRRALSIGRFSNAWVDDVLEGLGLVAE